MKKHISTGIAILSCTLTIVCLFQIAELKSQLWSVQGNLFGQISGITNSVNNITYSIQNALAEQAAILSSSEWSFGEADFDAKTVEVHISATPKEFRPGETAATLICNNNDYPMALVLENGTYETALSIPMFETSTLSKVQFMEDGTVRTENLDWSITPRYDFLPLATAHVDGGGRGTSSNGVYTWFREGLINICFSANRTGATVQSITMAEYMDGAEVLREAIPLNTTYGNMVNENAGAPVRALPDGLDDTTYYYYTLNKKYEIPFGSKLEVYIDIVDTQGLRYRIPVEYAAVDPDGRLSDYGMYWWDNDATIFDANGAVLWAANGVLN